MTPRRSQAIDHLSVLTSPSPGHAWAIGLSIGLALVVCIRFFSENLGIVPGLVQYIDVPVTALAVMFALSLLARHGHRLGVSRLATFSYLFILVSVLSATSNPTRAQLLPTAMFIFNFVTPLIFAIIIIDARFKSDDIKLLLRTFFWLGVVELVVGLLYGIPLLVTTGNPDYVSGTFGRNAYQFTYFIGVWLLYVLADRW